VYGRNIAGATFNGYSEGLKNKTGIWNEESLDEFLRDVDGFSKDSSMAFPGVSDDEVRTVVIEYLKSLQ
jgi:cytochrome c2